MRGGGVLLLLAMLALTGCGTVAPSTELPRAQAAYASFMPADGARTVPAYRIAPLDVLRIAVFQEPELSFERIVVDAAGDLVFPLIGMVRAQGRTAGEVSGDIAGRLGARYLRRAEVAVSVVTSTAQTITVEGQVTDPGVFDIAGSTTLLQMLARAKGPTRVAKLDQAIVFRIVDGRRTGAVFDVAQIRAGRMPDPMLIGGDTVVMGFSGVKGGFRDFLQTAPFFNLFRPF